MNANHSHETKVAVWLSDAECWFDRDAKRVERKICTWVRHAAPWSVTL